MYLKTTFARLAGASRHASMMLDELGWFALQMAEAIYRVRIGAAAAELDVDAINVRELAVSMLRIGCQDKLDRYASDLPQAMKVIITDAVEKSFAVLTDGSALDILEGHTSLRPSLGAETYLGIVVPSPSDSRQWVYRSSAGRESLFRVSGDQKLVLCELWKAKGEVVRKDDLCVLVWGIWDLREWPDLRNRLNVMLSAIRAKVRPHGLEVVYNAHKGGYALIPSFRPSQKGAPL